MPAKGGQSQSAALVNLLRYGVVTLTVFCSLMNWLAYIKD